MAPRTEDQFEEMRNKSRDSIITAALELFAQKGFHNTSMAQVAKAAGVSKGLIYNYFESKDELLKGVFELGLKDADVLFEEHQEADPRERLRGMLEHTFRLVEQHMDYYKLMTTLMFQPSEIASIQGYLDQAGEYKMARFAALFQEIGCADPMNDALYFGAILDGIMMGWFVLGDAYPIEVMKKKVFEHVDRL